MNLLPYLTGTAQGPPHERMFWRFTISAPDQQQYGGPTQRERHKRARFIVSLPSGTSGFGPSATATGYVPSPTPWRRAAVVGQPHGLCLRDEITDGEHVTFSAPLDNDRSALVPVDGHRVSREVKEAGSVCHVP